MWRWNELEVRDDNRGSEICAPVHYKRMFQARIGGYSFPSSAEGEYRNCLIEVTFLSLFSKRPFDAISQFAWTIS